jgi:hypothetical protein
MKFNILLFLVFLCSYTLVAQKATTEQLQVFNLQDNFDAISNLTESWVGGQGFDNRYEGIKGNPFLFDDWYPANVRIKGQLFEDTKVSYKVNLEKKLVVARYESGKYSSVRLAAFDEIHIKKGNTTSIFAIVYPEGLEGNNEEAKVCELLYDGSYRLLKQHLKLIKKADFKQAYSTDVRYDEYQSSHLYFIQNPDGELQKVKLKKKAIAKAFPELEKKMNTFAKKYKDGEGDEARIAAFLKSLDEE